MSLPPLPAADPIYVRTLEIQWHWLFPEGEEKGLQATAEGITSIDFHPSSYRICTTGVEKSLRIWQLHDEHLKGWLMDSTQDMQRCCTWITTMLSTDIASCARWSPCGSIICSGHIGGAVKLWWREGPPTTVTSSNCQALGDSAVGAADSPAPLEVWKDFRELKGHFDDINDVTFTPNAKYILSVSMHGQLCIHELDGLTSAVFFMEVHSKFCQSVTVDPWNRLIATLGGGPSLSFFLMTPKTETRRLQLTNQKKAQGSFLGELCSTSLRRAAWSPDGSLFAAPCGKAKEVPEDMRNCFYVFARQQLESPMVRFSVKGASEVLGCAWAPCFFEPLDGGDMDVGNGDASMRPWGPAEYRMALAVWTSDSVVVYTTDSGCRHSDFTDLHFSTITSVSWSHDGRFLLTSSMDGYVSVVMYHHPIGRSYSTPQSFATHGYCHCLSALLRGLQAEAASTEHKRTEAASRISVLAANNNNSDAKASVAVVKKKKRLEDPSRVPALPLLPAIDASELASLLS